VDLLVDGGGVALAAAALSGDNTVFLVGEASPGGWTVPVGLGPVDVDFAGVGEPLFVVNYTAGTVSIIPAPYTAVAWTITVGATSGPRAGVFSSTLDRYFVVNSVGGDITAIALTPAATGGG